MPHLTDIKSLYQLYLETHVSAHLSSRTKADHKVNNALDSRLEREKSWSKKFSITVYSQNKVDGSDASLPYKKRKSILTKSVKDEMTEIWANHLKNLVVQGDMFRIAILEKSDHLWKSFIYNLPKGIMKFMLNSFLDTLPTKNNLSRWGKRINTKCDLCGYKETLQHVLNNCKVMLDQGRYTWRHDSVLRIIMDTFTDVCDPAWKVYCDLAGATKIAGTTIPPDIMPTQQRPDLVFVNDSSKSIIIFELTIPFEQNIQAAHDRKINKYAGLTSDLREQGYDAKLICFEILVLGECFPTQTNVPFNLSSPCYHPIINP
jgi:hypothetical protein